MNKAYLLLGGNTGDRKKNLQKAELEIEKRAGVILKKSSIYNTEPWGYKNQPDFLNRAVLVETNLSPSALMKTILNIEKDLGRKRKEVKWAERNIDIDILAYAQGKSAGGMISGEKFIIRKKNPVIPHPFMHMRKFSLIPLMEIEPGLEHPVFHATLAELLKECRDKSRVKRIGNV